MDNILCGFLAVVTIDLDGEMTTSFFVPASHAEVVWPYCDLEYAE